MARRNLRFPTGPFPRPRPAGDWAMPIDRTLTYSTVFVIGTDAGVRKAVGTGFLITVPSDSDELPPHGYVMTCAHVVRPHLDRDDPIALRFRTFDGTLQPDVPVTDWRFPLPDQVDLTLAPFDVEGVELTGVSTATQVLPVNPSREMRDFLGMPLHYIGLLLPQRDMELEGVAMVRSGSLGHTYQPGIRYHESSGDPRSRLYEYEGHLIDCRSYEGFSGSPVYAEFQYPILVPYVPPFAPPPGYQPKPMGTIDHFHFLFGMITGHLRDRYSGVEDPDGAVQRYGVATVLPIDYIWAALGSERLMEERRQHDDALTTAIAEAPGPFEPSRRRPASQPAKRDMDERVKLDMPFEDAVKALLDTKPETKTEGPR